MLHFDTPDKEKKASKVFRSSKKTYGSNFYSYLHSQEPSKLIIQKETEKNPKQIPNEKMYAAYTPKHIFA